jgi:hypothetical protein
MGFQITGKEPFLVLALVAVIVLAAIVVAASKRRKI